MAALVGAGRIGGSRVGSAPPAPPAARFPCFDGLRALAALFVVLIHTTFVSGFTTRSALGIYTSRLEIGVAVFFLISGFLLYRPFVDAHFGRGSRPSTRRFWARRLLRIVPGYWLAFSVIILVLRVGQVPGGWKSWLVYYGFGQIYSPTLAVHGVTQAWSLCTEITFYAMLPLYAMVVRGRRFDALARRRDALTRELVGLGVLVAISLGFRIWCLQQEGALARIMADWLPANLDLFALGMLLAVMSRWLRDVEAGVTWFSHPAMPWASWAAALVLFVAVSHLGISKLALYNVSVGVGLLRQTLYGLFAFCLLLPAVVGPQDEGFIRRLLQWRPLVGLGVVSYGIYLWHQSWIDLYLRWTGDELFHLSVIDLTATALGLAVLSATASYLLVERPALRFGHRRLGTTRGNRREADSSVAD